MDAITVVLVVTFALSAAADWRAIWEHQRARRRVTKTAATVMLVAIAGLAGEMDGAARAALVVAAVLSLVGDVALLGDSEERFLLGLSAFALAHLAYVATALLVGVSWPRLAIAFPVLAALLGFQAITRIVSGTLRHGGRAMMAAVIVYTVIISAMVVTATGTPSWLAFVGATLFAVSDSVIAYNRFVQPVSRADLPIMVTYHLGQVLLVAGLIVGG